MAAVPPTFLAPPCRLTRDEVLLAASLKDGAVPLANGKCQNGYVDSEGVERVCNHFLGEHPRYESVAGKLEYPLSALRKHVF